jgi:hypothetical protein
VVTVGEPVVDVITAASAPLEKGIYDQVFVAVFITDAALLVARAVIVPEIVTPPVAVTVQAPAPRFRMLIRVPVG